MRRPVPAEQTLEKSSPIGPREAPGGAGRSGRLRLLWITALAALVIPLGPIPALGTHASPSAPMAHAGPAVVVHAAVAAPAPTAAAKALPGSDGKVGPLVDPSYLSGFHVLPPVPGTDPAENLTHANNLAGVPSPDLGPTPALGDVVRVMHQRQTAAPVHSAGYTIPLGTFSGFINDTVDRSGIGGVFLSVYSKALCPAYVCAPVTTSSNGSFKIACPAAGGIGSDDAVVIIGTSWWFDNLSYDTCIAHQDVNVGTIYLVRDGVAVGVVRDASTQKPVQGVVVQALTRDYNVLAYPAGVSALNGSFTAAIPPVPAKILFTPPPGYVVTFNFTNATPGTGSRSSGTVPPWGGGLNLGPMYLTRQTLVQAELYDSATLQPFSGGLAAMTACDAHGNGCGLQGHIVSGYQVRAFANPGDDYFEAFANTHMESFSPALRIPAEPPGTVFDMGKIFVVPSGTFPTKGAFSEPTGGRPPWGAPNSPFGSIYAIVCSMDGYFTSYPIPPFFLNMTSSSCTTIGCWNLGSTVTIVAPPLRDEVRIYPDTTGVCDPGPPPVPQWPVPGYTPTWRNTTYVNLTAGHGLGSTVWLNFTPGDYIAGHVFEAGTTSAPQGCWTVSQTSTDNNFWNEQSYYWNSCLMGSASYGPCNSATPIGTGSFCLGVPPGNAKITVSDPGYNTNWTWAHVPLYCCRADPGPDGYPANLSAATTQHVRAINITFSTGVVHGWAIDASTGAPVATVTVQACPAPILQTANCFGGFGTNGTFYNIPGPTGTDVVTVTSAGYAPNSVWANITTRGNLSVGTVPLYPLAVLEGKVVDPVGNPLYLADVKYCPLASATTCYNGFGNPVGPGITNTVGYYNGSVLGGWLPWATYVVVASAPGYTTDWTFVNGTSGGYTTLPTLTLKPIGVNDTPLLRPNGPAATNGGSRAAGVWVAGRVLDNQTGLGINIPGGPEIQLCPLHAPTCGGIPDGSNDEGFFNGSVIPGLYFLNLSPSGYVPASYFVNASLAGFIDLGNLHLEPEWWVAGKVVINPWNSVTLSTSGTFGSGYAPAADISGCDLGQVTCLNSLPLSANGSYNVSVPIGVSALLRITPSGTAFGNTPAGGFSANTTETNLSSRYTYLTGTSAYVGLDIFGFVFLTVWNNDTINESAAKLDPAFGLEFPSVSMLETGNFTSAVAGPADGGGFWLGFLPGGDGPNRIMATATDNPGYDSFSGAIAEALHAGDVGLGPYNFYLKRFGWIQTVFVARPGGAPVGDAGAQAVHADPRSGFTYTNNDASAQDGFLNLTAPYGRNVIVTATAPDFNGTNFTVAQVNGSATSFANGTGYSALGSFSLPSYGWAIAATLNYSSGAPPLAGYPAGVVYDWAKGLGLPGAVVAVLSSDPTVPSGGSVGPTNWAGQFYSEAPIGSRDLLRVSHFAYLTNVSKESVAPGQYLVFSTVNMTGYAVLAGTVVANPGGQPISGASVQACTTVKNQPICIDALTNVSGSFWIEAAPGDISLTVSALNFVDNQTFVLGCADCWINVGRIVLDQYGTVTGNVRGLPSGLPVEEANASLCSSLGVPTGPCGPASFTNLYGHFVVDAPPGEYVLAINDTNYNSTYLPVALSPGQLTSVGTLFLSEFGTAKGKVYDSVTSVPLSGVSVLACPVWAGGRCAPTQITDANGAYSFGDGQGRYTITASARGYIDGAGAVTLVAGVTTSVGPIQLDPLGSESPVHLSGTVVSAGASPTAIPTASVTAFSGDSIVAVGRVAGDGTFSLHVPHGSYRLEAAASGYRPVSLTVDATADRSGLLFSLPAMTYTVTGQVVDGLSGGPVPGATIFSAVFQGGSWSTLVDLGTADDTGGFSIDLANGSFPLLARAPSGGPVAYADAPFTVAVNGAPQTVTVSMAPPLVTVHGRVVDGASGLPIAGASVRIQGAPETGYRFDRTVSSDGSGGFVITLYVGDYQASATFGAYHPAQRAFTAAPPITNLTLTLAPISGSATTTAATSGAVLWAGALVAAGAVLLAAALFGRSRGREKPRSPG